MHLNCGGIDNFLFSNSFICVLLVTQSVREISPWYTKDRKYSFMANITICD